MMMKNNLRQQVDVFFVLSGFLLMQGLLSQIQRTGRVNVVSTVINRVLRMWPVMFVGMLIFLRLCVRVVDLTFVSVFAVGYMTGEPHWEHLPYLVFFMQ